MGVDPRKHQVIGVYVSLDVREFLESFLYDHAGVIDIDEYFAVNEGHAPEGDPMGRIMSIVFEEILEDFEELVDEADFEEAESIDPQEFELTRVAADGQAVYEFRDLVEEVRIEKGFDSRVIHTAILREAINRGVFESVDLVVG
jgi:hypothetical protein